MRMEAKINIAEILKDKPKGTKLYSPIFGKLRYEDLVPDLGELTVVTSDNTSAKHSFRSDSRYNRHGEPLMLLPSKEMPDWSKFAWKKGDVLITEDGSTKVIFKCFEDDTYLTFKGKYCLQETNIDETFIVDTKKNLTECFSLQAKNIAQIYIHNIEDRIGGMLNMETLEIEKSLSEFKDGDIVYAESDAYHYPTIHILNINGDTKRYYARLVNNGRYYEAIDYDIPAFDDDDPNRLRLATEEEKQQLFSALAKEGKAWDSEKKQVVELKHKIEFKPFDKVLVRDSKLDKWRANLFGYIDKDECYHCVYVNWAYCIPYEGNEHLLGTTKDVEG